MADHQHISIALANAINELIEQALENGHPPPADVVGDLLPHIDHVICKCGEPKLDREPYPHIATGRHECSKGSISAHDLIKELLGSGLVPHTTIARIVLGYKPEGDIYIEVHGAVIVVKEEW